MILKKEKKKASHIALAVMASNTVASKSMEPVLDFAAVSTLSLHKGIWRALYIFITCREKWRGQHPDLISHVHVHARVRVLRRT